MSRRKTVTLPCMGLAVMPGSVYFADSLAGVQAFARERNFDPEGCWPMDHDNALAITSHSDKFSGILVAIDRKGLRDITRNEARALMAHEAVHAARAVFKRMGESTPGEETEAYLVQAITLFLINQLDRV